MCVFLNMGCLYYQIPDFNINLNYLFYKIK